MKIGLSRVFTRLSKRRANDGLFPHKEQLMKMSLMKPTICKHTIVLAGGVKSGERRWPSRSAAGKLPHLLAECPHSFLSQAEWPTLMWVFLCGNSHSTSLPHHITTHSRLKEMFLHHSTSRGFHLAVWELGPKQQAFPASSRLPPASSTQEHRFLPSASPSVLLRRSTTLNQGDSTPYMATRGEVGGAATSCYQRDFQVMWSR